MILRLLPLVLCLLITAEEGQRPYLGLVVDAPAGIDATGGVVVTKVVPGTTAEALGLRVGDVVLRINDRPINQSGDVGTATEGWKVGTQAVLSVRRGTEAVELKGAVVEAPRPRELGQQAQALERQVAQLQDPAVVPGHRRLEELLTLLQQVEKDLPQVAGEFRRHYPKGRFDISIHIDISSDPAEAQPHEIQPAAVPLKP